MLPLYKRDTKNVTSYTHENVRENMLWCGSIRNIKSTGENPGLEMEAACASEVRCHLTGLVYVKVNIKI